MHTQEPHEFFTGGTEQRPYFETYEKEHPLDTAEQGFESVRAEVAAYYNVPPEHSHVVPDTGVAPVRTRRAFSVVSTALGNRYYIDGHLSHADLLERLQAKPGVSFDVEKDDYTVVSGFIDPDGFADVPMVQEEAKKSGHPITWFVRYTVLPANSYNPLPSAPQEMN